MTQAQALGCSDRSVACSCCREHLLGQTVRDQCYSEILVHQRPMTIACPVITCITLKAPEADHSAAVNIRVFLKTCSQAASLAVVYCTSLRMRVISRRSEECKHGRVQAGSLRPHKQTCECQCLTCNPVLTVIKDLCMRNVKPSSHHLWTIISISSLNNLIDISILNRMKI